MYKKKGEFIVFHNNQGTLIHRWTGISVYNYSNPNCISFTFPIPHPPFLHHSHDPFPRKKQATANHLNGMSKVTRLKKRETKKCQEKQEMFKKHQKI